MSCLKQPAAGLVRLALSRWQLRGIRADNISAIVILLDSSDNVRQSSVTKYCDQHRLTKDVLHRVRLRRRRRNGLRTVLGKICRLRAQRNACIMRSPLACYNQLQQWAGDDDNTEVMVKRPLRRHSYLEACSDDHSQRRRLGVVVRRRSDKIIRRDEDDVICGHQNVVDKVRSSNSTRSSRNELTDSNGGSEAMVLEGTSDDAGTDDTSLVASDRRSAINMCSVTSFDIPCVSA